MQRSAAIRLIELETDAHDIAVRMPERAISLFGQVVQEWPDRLHSLVPLARLLLKRFSYRDARPLWKRIAALQPHDAESLLALSRIYEQTGELEQAAHSCARILQVSPEDGDAMRMFERIVQQAMRDMGLAEAAKIIEARYAGRMGKKKPAALLKDLVKSIGANLETAGAEALPELESDTEFLIVILRKYRARLTDEIEAEATAMLARAAMKYPKFYGDLGRLKVANDKIDEGMAAFERMPKGATSHRVWLELAGLAAICQRPKHAVLFTREALSAADRDETTAPAVESLLRRHRLFRQGPESWLLLAQQSNDLTTLQGAARAIIAEGNEDRVMEVTLKALRIAGPLAEAAGKPALQIFDILRRAARALHKPPFRRERIEELMAAVKAPGPESAATALALGVIALGEVDEAAAASHFEDVRARGLPEGFGLNPDGEIALHHALHQRYGEALEAAGRAGAAAESGDYQDRLEAARRAAAFLSPAPAGLFPEAVTDAIFEEIAKQPMTYAPQPGLIATITAALGGGGSEKQTVTVLKRLAAMKSLPRPLVLVRSVEREDQRFYLKRLQDLDLNLTIYGANWLEPSKTDLELRHAHLSSRLRAAIDLLPYGMREDVIRLLRELIAWRPAAVHIRQDNVGAALACAIAGVPRFAVHRGTLSPDRWGLAKLQSDLTVRPMRHIYRRLCELPGFSLVNNSEAGSETDRAWTGFAEARPFKVIHNAVEFEELGRNTQPNLALRRELDIPAGAPVVGGVFRFQPVKRPLLWMQTARAVLARLPRAHFVAVGEGPMLEQCQEYAETYGLDERVHFAGVSFNVGGWYRLMDVLLLASEREGLPNVLIEAQHFGVPVVSCDVGGAHETLIEGVTGRLVPPDATPQEIAEAVIASIPKPEDRPEMRARAQEFVHREFSPEACVGKVLDVLGVEAAEAPLSAAEAR